MIKYIYTGLIHIALIAVCFYAWDSHKNFNKLKESYRITEALPINEVIKTVTDSAGNQIQHSKPSVASEDAIPISTQQLLDSVTEIIKMPSSGKVVGYTKVPFSTSVIAKATSVTDTLAQYENDNWYLSYNLKDSIFNGRYKGYYNQVDYEYSKYSILGKSFSKPIRVQTSWFNDSLATIGDTKTIVIEKTKKPKLINISNVNKFRSFDNSLLSGAEVSLNKGRTTVGGQYMYNFNTNKKEWEVQLKFGILK